MGEIFLCKFLQLEVLFLLLQPLLARSLACYFYKAFIAIRLSEFLEKEEMSIKGVG